MKRRYLIPLAVAGALAYGGVADAHTPDVSDNCNGLNVALTQYEGGSSNNRLSVTIDGATQTFDFGGDFTKSFAWSPTAAHAWTVTIDANRNHGDSTEWDRTFNGTESPCQTPSTTSTSSTTSTTTSPPTTTIPPTTTLGPETTTSTPSTTVPTPTVPSTTSPPNTTAPTTTTQVAVGEPPVPTTTSSIPPTAPPASVAAEPLDPQPDLPATGATIDLRLPVVLVGLGAFCWLLTRRRPT